MTISDAGSWVHRVQKVVHVLNDCFLDLLVFNAMKLFNYHQNISDDSDWITNIELWLEMIPVKFKYTTKKSDMCKGELLQFKEPYNISVRTKQYLRLGMYVVAIWSGIQIGLDLCSSSKRLYSFHQI